MAEIRIIDNETMQAISNFRPAGAQLVALDGSESPHQIVEKITAFVRTAKTDGRSFSSDETLALGILLGWQYVDGLGWHWNQAVWDGNEESSAIGVLNADNSLFINTMAWMNDVLSTERATNFMLNYNMVQANKVPPAQPNQALGFH